MSVEEMVIERLRVLAPEKQQEVLDFVDFLATKHTTSKNTQPEEAALAETDFDDFLPQLEAYEDGLARGEFQW